MDLPEKPLLLPLKVPEQVPVFEYKYFGFVLFDKKARTPLGLFTSSEAVNRTVDEYEARNPGWTASKDLTILVMTIDSPALFDFVEPQPTSIPSSAEYVKRT